MLSTKFWPDDHCPYAALTELFQSSPALFIFSGQFSLHFLFPAFIYLPRGLYANLLTLHPSFSRSLLTSHTFSLSLHWSVHSGLASVCDSRLTQPGLEQALLANWKTELVCRIRHYPVCLAHYYKHTKINTHIHTRRARWAVYWAFWMRHARRE